MQSILIFGSKKESRIDRYYKIAGKIPIGNEFVIEELDNKNGISIDQVRSAIKFLNTKPKRGDIKTIVIHEAFKMTVEAQNAILKTLEEPPDYALIVLLTVRKNDLLPTIISRCIPVKVISIKDNDYKSNIDVVDLLKSNIGSRIDWANNNKKKFKDKLFIDQFFTDVEYILREDLIENFNLQVLKSLDKLFLTKDNVEKKNCSVSLNIENLLINI